MTSNKQEPPQTLRIEPRWSVALAIVVVMGLLTALPDHIRLLPLWFPYILAMTILTSMATVRLARDKRLWLRIEKVVMLIFCLTMIICTSISLAYLLEEMVTGSKAIDGLYLLTSSIGLGVTNVLAFSLLYWRIDRGGPEARLNGSHRHSDFLFTQSSLSEKTAIDWYPTFVDYLFIAFTTATAFSPTDTPPLTARAKLLMMLESMIALVTIAAVASRAINILGS